MKLKYSFFLIFILVFLNFQCSPEGEKLGEKPSPVVMIEGVSDTSPAEKGIDAVPEGNGIQIEWIPSSDPYVIGYELFRSDKRYESYRLVADVDVLKKRDSVYVDILDASMLNTRFYYYIYAISDTEVKSDASDTLSYMLIEKAMDLSPQGNISESKPEFSWKDPNNPQKAAYVIRLKEALNDDLIWIEWVPSNYEDTQTVEYNSSGGADLDSLLTGMDYLWRVDIIGTEENSGSESQWHFIHIQ